MRGGKMHLKQNVRKRRKELFSLYRMYGNWKMLGEVRAEDKEWLGRKIAKAYRNSERYYFRYDRGGLNCDDRRISGRYKP
jgi:hypothetical protein